MFSVRTLRAVSNPYLAPLSQVAASIWSSLDVDSMAWSVSSNKAWRVFTWVVMV